MISSLVCTTLSLLPSYEPSLACCPRDKNTGTPVSSISHAFNEILALGIPIGIPRVN